MEQGYVDVAVIGAGQAASELVWSLRKHGYAGSIAIFGEEAHPPYERPPLSKKVLSEDYDIERTFLRGLPAFAQADIQLESLSRVEALDTKNRILRLADGRAFAYGVCVLATGARAANPTIAGIEHPYVHRMRSIDDAGALRAALLPGTRLTIVGGGYLGLEVAASAINRGCQVTVVEFAPKLLSRSLSTIASDFLMRAHEERGTSFRLGAHCVEIRGGQKLDSVILESGEQLPTDVALMAVGASPAIDLALQGGIACQNGIVTDALCRTSAEAVYAIGDCANHFSPRYQRHLRIESVQAALAQARILAAHLTGKAPPPPKPPTFWSCQFHHTLQIGGLVLPEMPVVDTIQAQSETMLVVERSQNGRLAAIEAIDAPGHFIRAQRVLDA